MEKTLLGSEMTGAEFGLWHEAIYREWSAYGDAKVGSEGGEFFYEWLQSMNDWYSV